MSKFDLVIIGGGAAAFGAAIRANELGAKTAMINGGLPLGGTCVNVGCVPSKTLLYVGEILHKVKHHGVPGVGLELKKFDFQRVIQDELSLVEKMRTEKYAGVVTGLNHVTLLEGKAKFISHNEVAVNGQTAEADKFIIASGSNAMVPSIDGIREVGYITHIEALRLFKLPEKLVVLGAGPVGLEFAQMYSRFGSQVTILQSRPSIFPKGEKALTRRLSEVLTDEGITIKTDVTVQKAYLENGIRVLEYTISGGKKTVAADEILLAAGKTPNTGNLGLEKLGVEINREQAVVVNQYFQTSNPNVFAAGDVTNAPLRLETTAGREGTLAASNALTGSREFVNYDAVPYTIFTDPQLAGVGLTEEQQVQILKACACRTVQLSSVPKAIITHRIEGLVKMIIHPKTLKILGVHVLAPNASDLIAQAMVLIENGNTIDDVINSFPVFPSLSETIKLAALTFRKDITKLSCCV